MGKRAVNVQVTLDRRHGDDKRGVDKMIRKFIRLCKKERIREEYRERGEFKPRSQKLKEKSNRAMRRRIRDAKKAEKQAMKNRLHLEKT